MRSISRAFILATALFIGPAMLSAQQPKILHAQFATQPVEGSLQKTIDRLKQAATPLWVGYTIPTDKPFRNTWDSSEISYLEKHGDTGHSTGERRTTEQDRAVVLFRLADGRIDQARVEHQDRQLDAGGLRFVWITDVKPDESVAVWKDLSLTPQPDRILNTAVLLISLHRSAAAVPALTALAGPGPNLHLREQSAFWLSHERGHEGFLAIQNLARNDKDEAFRAKLAFDLGTSKDPEALKELLRMAHEDASPHVRSQAQFWMASLGGKLVVGALRESAENDPDAGIRKRAVFAMSRLPDGEAAPQLVQLAETSKYPEVRKEAVFWLGQSNDPKALDYLTKLLTKR